jgi:homoserine O-succinyltransferase
MPPEPVVAAWQTSDLVANERPRPGVGGDPLVIGLVNNMPDAALHATERQFRRLISAAAGDLPVRLRLFYLPEVPRSDRGRRHLEQHYEPANRLWPDRLDGLIVTGTEPRAADLRDEPYWAVLARLVDWAEQHTISTVWSCLAAHAAVLHRDGIGRRELPGKLCGVFECCKTDDHPIVRGTPSRWRVSHSRYNEVPEAPLASCGYRVLSRSDEVGADLFVRQQESLFVYFQGHPEYDPDTLGREYRRDIGRFLKRERSGYPEMPRGYFDAAATAALVALKERALSERSPETLSSYPEPVPETAPRASPRFAVTIYSRWLSLIASPRWRGRAAESVSEPRWSKADTRQPHRAG